LNWRQKCSTHQCWQTKSRCSPSWSRTFYKVFEYWCTQSFAPSPIMATQNPSDCSCLIILDFCSECIRANILLLFKMKASVSSGNFFEINSNAGPVMATS
jgi:hypothetical protein